VSTERIDVSRTIPASPSAIFAILTDPEGHVSIDSSGMLMRAEGSPVRAVGDEFLVHMDRESLGDYPLGLYDVTVTITKFEQDRLIEWSILGVMRPPIGHRYGYTLEPGDDGTVVTSYCDWSDIDASYKDAGVFPVISAVSLRATLGILARTLARATAGA
jgi:hypothetical protein